jgi:hypothetical protein
LTLSQELRTEDYWQSSSNVQVMNDGGWDLDSDSKDGGRLVDLSFNMGIKSISVHCFESLFCLLISKRLKAVALPIL